MNCWEFMKCGRQPDGHKINQLGICPASTEQKYDGTNHGKNAGRCCWKIPETNCKNTSHEIPSLKIIDCIGCDFFQLVQKEEKHNFTFLI